MKIKSSKIFKIIAIVLCFFMAFEQSGFAQVAGQLDISGQIAAFRNNIVQDKFRPLHLRYLQFDSQLNNFKLLLDKGNAKILSKAFVEESTKTLLQYFLVGVTLPNDAFWVNLRPDSPDNVIDPLLGQTEVGKILLEADVQLKKDTARFTSPETTEGKEYWDKLYVKAGEIFGSQNVTIPTLTRPWIVPDEIILRETSDNAYIYKATLKVMLEDDYLKGSVVYNFDDPRLKELNTYASSVLREKIIPKLTQEINASKKYAALRQVYYSLILAQWFKQRFYGKNSLYTNLINKKNLDGLISRGSWSKNTYFQQYQKSFKDGEYNFKVPMSTPYGQVVRSYFSGGIALGLMSQVVILIKGRAADLIDKLPLGLNNKLIGVTRNKDGSMKIDETITTLVAQAAQSPTTSQSLRSQAEQALGRSVSEQEFTAIQAAHDVGADHYLDTRNEDGTYNKNQDPNRAYTAQEIAQKARILAEAGFTQDERAKLIKFGVVGNVDESFIPQDMAVSVAVEAVILGKSKGLSVGNKAKGLDELSSIVGEERIPFGIAFTAETVSSLLDNQDVMDQVIDRIIKEFSKGVKVSIRSSPGVSMPGMLETQLDVAINRDQLQAALIKVAQSWNSPKAKAFRTENNILEGSEFGIIVQEMKYGNKNDNSAVGVAFSRDPLSGSQTDNSIYGDIAINASAADIVSGDKSGESVASKMKEKFPELYKNLLKDVKELEKQLGYPVEVEFTIEDGVLYYLQVRRMVLSRSADIQYLEEKTQREGDVVSLPDLLRLQEALWERSIFSFEPDDSTNLVTLSTGLAATGGDIEGKAFFSLEAAGKYFKKYGKPVILVATSDNRDEILLGISRLPVVGLITTYGSGSSHEAIILRGLGIPSIINAQGIAVVSSSGKKEIVFSNGDRLSEESTESVMLLGDNRTIVQRTGGGSFREITDVGDLAYGLDLAVIARDFRESIWEDSSIDDLVELNIQKGIEYYVHAYIDKDAKKALKANLEKHVLHNMLKEKAEKDGKDEEFIAKLNERIRDGIEQGKLVKQQEAEAAATKSLDQFIKEIKSLHGEYPPSLDTIREMILKLYESLPGKLDRVVEVADAFYAVMERGEELPGRTYSMTRVIMFELALRQVYKKLLHEYVRGNQEVVAALEAVGRSLGRSRDVINSDKVSFKEQNIDNNVGYRMRRFGEVNWETSSSGPNSILIEISKELELFFKDGVRFYMNNRTMHTEHGAWMGSIDPYVVYPTNLEKTVKDIINKYMQELPQEQDYSVEDIYYQHFFSRLPYFSREILHALTRLGQDDRSSTGKEFRITTDEQLLKDDKGRACLINAPSTDGLIYVHPLFLLYYTSKGGPLHLDEVISKEGISPAAVQDVERAKRIKLFEQIKANINQVDSDSVNFLESKDGGKYKLVETPVEGKERQDKAKNLEINLSLQTQEGKVSSAVVDMVVMENNEGIFFNIDLNQVEFPNLNTPIDLAQQNLGSQILQALGKILPADVKLVLIIVNQATRQQLWADYYLDGGLVKSKKDGAIVDNETALQRVIAATVMGKLLNEGGFEEIKLSFEKTEGIEALRRLMAMEAPGEPGMVKSFGLSATRTKIIPNVTQEESSKVTALEEYIISNGINIESFNAFDQPSELLSKLFASLRKGSVVRINLKGGDIEFPTQLTWVEYFYIRNNFMSLANAIGKEFLGNTFVARFTVSEFLKNAFVHGNKGDVTLPIYLYINPVDNTIEIYDLAKNKELSEEELAAMRKGELYGRGQGLAESLPNNGPQEIIDFKIGKRIGTKVVASYKKTDVQKPNIPVEQGEQEKNVPGGIDFRALPITTQPTTSIGAAGITPGAMNVANIKIDQEWQAVENMLNAGIIPSLERIREYLILSCKGPDCQAKINQVLSGIADMFRLEEDHAYKTQIQLKEILILLESNRSAEQLSAALLKIKIMPQEPIKI